MKAGNMPWKKLTDELIKDNTVANKAEFEYGLLSYLNSMSEFSIDPSGVKKLPNDKLEKKFESREKVIKLMFLPKFDLITNQDCLRFTM